MKKIVNKIIKIAKWEEYFENPIFEYFNENNKQDFQKIIISKKNWFFIRHVPDHYWPIDSMWYALIRNINCEAKCTYCYLQSYFKSWDFVRFINIDDYIKFIDKFIVQFKKKYWDWKQLIFYDWDFYDSFWYYFRNENIESINKIINLISWYKNVLLEIRTKMIVSSNSLNYDLYNKLLIHKNVVYWITFSPPSIIKKYEKFSSNLDVRVWFAKYVCDKWWKIWIRIDPIIMDENFDKCIEIYSNMINEIFKSISKNNIFNYVIWTLRIKENLYKNLKKINNSIINNLITDNNFFRYEQSIRKKIYDNISNLIGSEKIIVCMDN